MTHVLFDRDTDLHRVTGAHGVDGGEPEYRLVPLVRPLHDDSAQRSTAAVVAQHGDVQIVFLKLALGQMIRCSLKTTRRPEPHSLSRRFEQRSSGHPLMVEGESRPKGAEHRASSYIVHGTAQSGDHSARVTLLLSHAAECDANCVLAT